MGNHLEPTTSAAFNTRSSLYYRLFSNNNTIDISQFYKNIPIEIQLHTFSYLCLQELPNLLLISKSLQNEILSCYELHTQWYIQYKNIRILHNFRRRTKPYPPKLDDISIPVSFCKELDHRHYYRLRWIVEDDQLIIENRMILMDSRLHGPKHFFSVK